MLRLWSVSRTKAGGMRETRRHGCYRRPVPLAGEAKHGKINIPFDRKFLDTLIAGDCAKLSAYSHEEINAEAGSGGHEIRTWIALAGALPEWRAELLVYEPIVPWATGYALVVFHRSQDEGTLAVSRSP